MNSLRPTTLVDLLDIEEERNWNEALIREIFVEAEVEQILSLPLSKMGSDDKMVWGPSRKGLFSVRSAYYLEMERRRNKGESSTEFNRDSSWDNIWKLNIPEKAKLFLWKAGNNYIATKSNLLAKKVMGNDLCPVCKLHNESVMHILWQCVASSDVWIESSARIQKWRISEDNFLDLIEKMAQILSKEEMEEVAMVMRSIWLRRNQLVFDNKFIPPRQLINSVREQLREFQRAKSVTVIIKAVNEENSDYPLYGSIVLDVKEMLMHQKGWKIQYVQRSSNGVAHKLAKEALHIDTEIIWMEESPSCIAECIEKDKDVIQVSS
ncbi:hypothetical protein I3760_01G047300 [Carya illinoinensis]|nr:hypothetical protein I3760_01G047300 [Carya illinoinensis]